MKGKKKGYLRGRETRGLAGISLLETAENLECRSVPALQLPCDIIERNFHVAITVRLVSKRDYRAARPLNAHAQKTRARRI